MNINVRDRLQILQLLPTNGTHGDLMVVKSILERIKFSDEEIEEHGLSQQAGGIKLEGDGPESEFEFEEEEFFFVSHILCALEVEEMLSLGQIGLYEMFCKA